MYYINKGNGTDISIIRGISNKYFKEYWGAFPVDICGDNDEYFWILSENGEPIAFLLVCKDMERYYDGIGKLREDQCFIGMQYVPGTEKLPIVFSFLVNVVIDNIKKGSSKIKQLVTRCFDYEENTIKNLKELGFIVSDQSCFMDLELDDTILDSCNDTQKYKMIQLPDINSVIAKSYIKTYNSCNPENGLSLNDFKYMKDNMLEYNNGNIILMLDGSKIIAGVNVHFAFEANETCEFDYFILPDYNDITILEHLLKEALRSCYVHNRPFVEYTVNKADERKLELLNRLGFKTYCEEIILTREI